MKQQIILIIALSALPLAAMEKPTLEKYLENREAETHSYMRNGICGTEIIVEKKGAHPAGYLLSCLQAQTLLRQLSQAADKDDYKVSYLKLRRSSGIIEEKYNISLNDAQVALAAFCAPIQTRITEYMKNAKQEALQEYENKYGPVEKK